MALIHSLLDLEKRPAARPYTAEGYDLRGFRAWVDRMGSPDRALRFIHVAGTKGKGSICAMVETMLRAQGLRTGLYTSPHLDHFGERIRTNNIPMTPEEFAAADARIEATLTDAERAELFSTGLYRTVFEVLTLMALQQFAAARADAVVWETGLGGRLDCTNIVDPVLSVISTIGLDHTKVLGETPELIAAEKAGIMKPARSVIVGRQQPRFADRVWPVFREHSVRIGTPLIAAEEALLLAQATPVASGIEVTFAPRGGGELRLSLPMHGVHQASNAQAAIVAAATFLRIPLTDVGALQRLTVPLEKVVWAGRLEILRRTGLPPMLLDGAHCPLSARAFRETVAEWQKLPVPPVRAPLALLCGMQADKDHDAFFAALTEDGGASLIKAVVTYPVSGSRGAPSDVIAAAAGRAGLRSVACSSLEEAWYAALGAGAHALASAGTLYSLAALRRLHGESKSMPAARPG